MTTSAPKLTAPAPRPRTRPTLAPIITRLRYPLAPLHPLPAGSPHAAFPATLLAYHLLTESQLDDLAAYYHQSSLSIWTYSYPACMEWDAEWLRTIGERRGMEERIRVKRRKWGRFIGLRGCETPIEEVEEMERWRRGREVCKGMSGEWRGRGGGRW